MVVPIEFSTWMKSLWLTTARQNWSYALAPTSGCLRWNWRICNCILCATTADICFHHLVIAHTPTAVHARSSRCHYYVHENDVCWQSVLLSYLFTKLAPVAAVAAVRVVDGMVSQPHSLTLPSFCALAVNRCVDYGHGNEMILFVHNGEVQLLIYEKYANKNKEVGPN